MLVGNGTFDAKNWLRSLIKVFLNISSSLWQNNESITLKADSRFGGDILTLGGNFEQI